MAKHVWLVALLACGSSQEPESQRSESTEGGQEEAAIPEGTATPEDTAIPEPVLSESDEGSGGMIMMGGRPESTGQTEQRAAFQSECVNTLIIEGAPPQPPPAPSSVRAIEATYEVTLEPPPNPPANGTLQEFNDWASGALASWIAEMSSRMEVLEQAVAPLTGHDLVVGAVWVAHAYGSIVQGLNALPAPPAISNDPELLLIYRSAFHEPMLPLLNKSEQAMNSLQTNNPNWSAYASRLREWLIGYRCAMHPGRP